MGGAEAFHSSGSDSWEYESSDEDGPTTLDNPPARTGEPYTALPSQSSSASSFPQKAALHLFELFDLSEEETGYSGGELSATHVTLLNTAQIESGATNKEQRPTNEAESMLDEEEEVVTLLLADGKGSLREEGNRETQTCFLCRRCPCSKSLGKEERAMRWLLLCGFFFCIPWAAVLNRKRPTSSTYFETMYMGLCTTRKKNRGLRQIGRFAALLWCLAWTVLIAVCIAVSIILIRGNKELLLPLRWDTPYSMRQTTRCGTRGVSIKVEHEAMTHILSEKTYGTVAFFGLMPAKTWSDAELLKHVYNLGFDAVALSPPGIGATTNVTSLKDSFYNEENFLNQVLESCLDIRLTSTVVVSHSNIITRQYFFPLLMNTALLGFVLFDSYTGEDWITEVNPALNDHLFYSPKTRNYRYVGNRRLSEELYRSSAIPVPQETALAAGGAEISPTNLSNTTTLHTATLSLSSIAGANKRPARLLQAVNCIAAEFNAESEDAWEGFELQTLGPYQFFPGKYKVSGWGLRQAELLAAPLDPPPDKKSSLLDVLSSTGAGILSGLSGSEEHVESILEETRLVPSRQTPIDYFKPLIEALTDILTEIKDKIDLGTYHSERLPVAFREDRKQAYTKARIKTTLIDPSTIYCLHGSSTIDSDTLKKLRGDWRSVFEDRKRTRREEPEHDNSAKPETLRTEVNIPSLRGGVYYETPVTPTVEKETLLGVEQGGAVTTEGPAGHREYLGKLATPVNPERFAPEDRQKLLEAYAIRDRIRTEERAKKRARSSRLYTAAHTN